MYKIFLPILTTLVFSAASAATAQQPDAQKKVIVLDGDTPPKRNTLITYIGEIKGRTYIRLIFEHLAISEGSNMIPIRGTCYEAASGKTYPISGIIDPETGTWNLKCLNHKKQTVYTFKGKENLEGTIEGDWKSKHAGLPFYLFKKETPDSL